MTNSLDEGGRVYSLDVKNAPETAIGPVINDEITDDEENEKISKKKISSLEARRKLEDNLDVKKYVKLWIIFMVQRKVSAMNQALVSLQF